MSEALIAFIKAREELRIRKEAGMKQPWTLDPILAKYRFTNVRRRDDRVSRWIIKHVAPRWQHPEFLPFLALCRWVNWPPTLFELLPLFGSEFGSPPGWGQMIHTIDRITATGTKAWTGAYMVRGDNRQLSAPRSKAEYIIKDVCLGGIHPIITQIMQLCSLTHTRRPVWELVRERLYWGDFMAGQLVDDMTWTPLLTKPLDDCSWAPQGPGSRRGFNRLMGRPLKTRIPEEEWLSTLRLWREAAIYTKPLPIDLTLMDLQNCLCEYDKYERVRLGEGRPRSYYKPDHYPI